MSDNVMRDGVSGVVASPAGFGVVVVTGIVSAGRPVFCAGRDVAGVAEIGRGSDGAGSDCRIGALHRDGCRRSPYPRLIHIFIQTGTRRCWSGFADSGVAVGVGRRRDPGDAVAGGRVGDRWFDC